MDRNGILRLALAQRPDAVRRELTTGIRAADPRLTVVEVNDQYGDLVRFTRKGHCELNLVPEFASDFIRRVDDDRICASPQSAWWTLTWQNVSLEMVEIHLHEGFHRISFVLLLSKHGKAIDEFLFALGRFSREIEGAVLVFQDGCWRYDEELYGDIAQSTFDNLILPSGLAETIQKDVRQWLDSRALYEEYGIPWKRGLILVGPPGNGKTHLIKAIVNAFDLAALYVRGFAAEYKTDAENISAIFARARDCAPSLLIFEDVDTLVTPENRSHFLNELDGFARNTGILAIASANDPAQLDPALVNRPSRFDRRYVFDLPGDPERARYLAFFTARLQPSLRLSIEESEEIGLLTEGFSYAYLKELVLSGMMAWISAGGHEPFVNVLRREAVPLQAQMSIDAEPTPRPIAAPSQRPRWRGPRR